MVSIGLVCYSVFSKLLMKYLEISKSGAVPTQKSILKWVTCFFFFLRQQVICVGKI